MARRPNTSSFNILTGAAYSYSPAPTSKPTMFTSMQNGKLIDFGNGRARTTKMHDANHVSVRSTDTIAPRPKTDRGKGRKGEGNQSNTMSVVMGSTANTGNHSDHVSGRKLFVKESQKTSHAYTYGCAATGMVLSKSKLRSNKTNESHFTSPGISNVSGTAPKRSHKKIAASRASQTNINVLQGPSYTPAPVPTLTPTPAPAAVATSNSNSNNKTSTSATANSNSNSNRNSGGSVTSASVQLATAESIATSDSLHTGRKHGHSQAEHGVVPSGGAFIDDRKKALTRKARKITRKNIPDYTKRKNSEVQHRGKKTFSHIHTPRENHPAVRLKKMDSSSSHPRSHIPFGSKAVREKLPLHESVRMKGTAGQKNGYLTRSSFSFSTQPIESYKMKKAKGVTDRHRQSSFNTNPNKFRAQKKKEAGKVTWAARRSSSSVFAGENGCSDSNVASAMSTASMLTKNVTRGSPSSSKSMSKSASSPRLFTTAQQQKASAQAQAWASKRNRTSSVFQMNNRNFNGVGGGEKLEKTHAGGMFRIGEQQGAGADTAARPMTARGSGGRAQRSARGPPPSRPAVAWR